MHLPYHRLIGECVSGFYQWICSQFYHKTPMSENNIWKTTLYKLQKEVLFAVRINIYLFLSKFWNFLLAVLHKLFVFCKSKFVVNGNFQKFYFTIAFYMFIFYYKYDVVRYDLFLFIDDPRNIWNLPGLATILLIRNQFGIQLHLTFSLLFKIWWTEWILISRE